MQLKDVTPIIKAILEERDKIPLMINTERYISNWQPNLNGNAMRGGIRKALRIIEQAPAVEAVPVVHGYWIANNICSVCKEGIRGWAIQGGYKFCPNCGAKMGDQADAG